MVSEYQKTATLEAVDAVAHLGMQDTALALDTFTRLEQQFSLPEPGTVHALLVTHPYLMDLLLEAGAQLQPYFPTATLWLGVANDPDDVSYSQLLVAIGTNLSAEAADAQLQHFVEAWWLDEMYRAQGLVSIILRFQ